MFSPWTLDVSTHVYNPSYVLAGAIAFFVGAFEVVPSLRCGVLSRPLSFFLMGLACSGWRNCTCPSRFWS